MSDEQVNTAEEQKTEGQDPSDKMTPDHPRFKEVYNEAKESKAKVTQLETELAELKQKISERQVATGDSEFTEEEEKALERIEKGLAKRGFIKKEELDASSFQLRLEKEFQRLSEKYDGSSGEPKFVADEVFAYAKKKGMQNDLEGAYKLMNYDTLIDVEIKKRSQGPKPPTSERPTSGTKIAANLSLTTEDIKNMSSEEWEAQRDKILQSLR